MFRYETRSDYRRQEELRRDREVRGRERERELSREHGSSHQYSSSHVSSNLVRDTEARAGDRRKRRWVVLTAQFLILGSRKISYYSICQIQKSLDLLMKV